MFCEMRNSVVICILCVLSTTFRVFAVDLTSEDGHMKPFGTGRPNSPVTEVQKFLAPREFFENYVIPGTPLLMKGGAKSWKGYHLWSDEYLGSTGRQFDHLVSVEPIGGLKRFAMVQFAEFIETYQTSRHYMTTKVPPFLRYVSPISAVAF